MRCVHRIRYKGVRMEGFDLISTGAWSILPPLLALGLALGTKEVYSSLIIGVFSGTLIYEFSLEGVGWDQLVTAFTMLPQIMAAQIADNGALLLFLALLGALVMIIAAAGGSRAYGEWVSSHIKSARAALVLTSLLGIIIFVDDYFNCLTVGAVMRPVTDRFHISHEKLAWIIDSTAAPVCIIAPVSSWAVAVGGYIGDDGFTTFIASIPYNFYALLTIFFVFYICFLNKDYGPMRQAQIEYEAGEARAAEKQRAAVSAAAASMATASAAGTMPTIAGSASPIGRTTEAQLDEALANDDASSKEFFGSKKISEMVQSDEELQAGADEAIEEFNRLEKTDKGTVWDLVIPIVVLIIFSIWGMLYVGGFFAGGVDFGAAVGEDPITGLCIGVTVSLLVTAVMFLPRKLLTLTEYAESIVEGGRSMVSAIMILVLAWSLGGVCRYMLGTGEFVSSFLNSVGVDLAWLPAIIFVVAAFISFAMGTSWGTIALILPIVIGVFPETSPLYLVAIGATLGGAVYGDHVSPISDTTILSSAGATCNHLRHVTTQLAYATVVMLVCIVCFIIVGFTDNPWIGLAVGIALIVVIVPVLMRVWSGENTKVMGGKKAA